jgi:hypothetical protein
MGGSKGENIFETSLKLGSDNETVDGNQSITEVKWSWPSAGPLLATWYIRNNVTR